MSPDDPVGRDGPAKHTGAGGPKIVGTGQLDPSAADRDAALAGLARVPRLLVALDFDGTVSRFVDDPDDARMVPAAAASVAWLKRLPETWVAFLSGRGLKSLTRATDSRSDALLIGSHGAEVRLAGLAIPLDLDAVELARLAELERALTPLVAEVPKARLERKPVGFAVHARRVDPALVPELRKRVRAAVAPIEGLRERKGKNVLEYSVRQATKADGLAVLRRVMTRDGRPVSVLYAGDDETDEDAFAALTDGDVGIKVGDGRTRATFRAADPDELGRLLVGLAAAREASAPSSHAGR